MMWLIMKHEQIETAHFCSKQDVQYHFESNLHSKNERVYIVIIMSQLDAYNIFKLNRKCLRKIMIIII